MSKLIIESLRLTDTNKNTVFTIGEYAKAKVDAMTVVNTTAGAITYSVYRVKKGGTASDSNAIVRGATLKANDTMLLELPIYLDNGYSIVVETNVANSATFHLDAKYI